MNDSPHHASRIVWVDLCRVLCAFLIVLGHCPRLLSVDRTAANVEVLANYLFFAHGNLGDSRVFAFFVLAGVFIHYRSTEWLLWRRFFFLLVSFLAWNLVALFLFHYTIGSSQYGWGFHTLWTALGGVPFVHGANGPLWFLKYLCLFSLIAPSLCRLSVSSRLAVSLLALLAGSANFNWTNQDFVYANETVISFGFFLAGTCLREIGLARVTANLKKAAPLLLIGGLAFSLAMLLGAPLASTATAAGRSILGVLFIFAVCILMEQYLPRRLSFRIASMGKASFFIYAYHMIAIKIFERYHVDLGRLSILWPVIFFFAGVLLYKIIARYASFLLPYLCLEKRKNAAAPCVTVSEKESFTQSWQAEKADSL